MDHTQIEASLQTKFVLGRHDECVISYPTQMIEYVSCMCKFLKFFKFPEKPQFDEGEEYTVSN